MNAVKSCDLLVALYNGNAGSVNEQGDVGICHAELSTALNLSPGKVHLIDISDPIISLNGHVDPDSPNGKFQKFVKEQSLFTEKPPQLKN